MSPPVADRQEPEHLSLPMEVVHPSSASPGASPASSGAEPLSPGTPSPMPQSRHTGGVPVYLASPRDAKNGAGAGPPRPRCHAVEADLEFGAVSSTPFPDVKMARTRSNARPGDVIVGYQLTEADAGCFQCSTLTPTGLLLVILLSILFFPLALLICFLPQFHESVQRPVYGPAPPPPAEWMEKVRPHYIPESGAYQ